MNKILLLSDLTLEVIKQKVEKKFESNLIDIESQFGDINLLIKNINLSKFDCIILIIDPYFMKYSNDEYLSIVASINSLLSSSYNGTIIINNFLNTYPSTQLFYASNDLNQLTNKFGNTSNIILLDYIGLIAKVSISEFYNYNLGHLYQMPYSKTAIGLLVDSLYQTLASLYENEKKVIILDCDNTLWGGVLGEEGFEQVKCDKNADGILYFHFQNFLSNLKNSGFLLCICSKNNYNDVSEAFANRNMPLKLSDFIVTKINWENKAQNIQSIAEELNLGLDACVFIDDSDFELGMVNQLIPQVTTLQFKNNYSAFLDLINSNKFKKKHILAEDKLKTQQYIQNKHRDALKDNSDSIDDYIKSLELKQEHDINNISQLSRLAQLTEKTNQFNFNKISYSAEQLTQFIADGNLIISLKVSDRYGDYGIVGLALVRIIDTTATIENILISCRALGRRIEYNFWNYIKKVISQKDLKLVNIDFAQTAKNKPAQEFYDIIKKDIN